MMAQFTTPTLPCSPTTTTVTLQLATLYSADGCLENPQCQIRPIEMGTQKKEIPLNKVDNLGNMISLEYSGAIGYTLIHTT
jgi:hypothetical protein